MSLITAVATANPDNRFSQPDIAAFMLKMMRLENGESARLRAIFRASGIEYRHSVISDYGRTSKFLFYPEDLTSPFPTTRDRLEIFREHALPLSVRACEKLFNDSDHISRSEITHLIVVCCTGMYAPGLDIGLVKALGLSTAVDRTAINFMGCYAAFNALKIADAFCRADPDAKVLIVCTELCSIHFQREGTEDNLLSNALFGDGSAAVIVEAKTKSRLQLHIEGFHNELSTTGLTDMAWTIGDLGFEMKLSSYVPEIIRKGIVGLASSLMKKISRELTDVKHFVIHPGGKKILEVIEAELNIPREKNRSAYEVLRKHGNMSSPTILFVLAEQIKKFTADDKDENILSFAFGPGLTMESMVLRINSV